MGGIIGVKKLRKVTNSDKSSEGGRQVSGMSCIIQCGSCMGWVEASGRFGVEGWKEPQ